jgi:hypothetical protein
MVKIITDGLVALLAVIASVLQILKLPQVCWRTVTAFLINGNSSKAKVLTVVWIINDSAGFVFYIIFLNFM